MTMMVFVLIILEQGKRTGEEFFFRELTSCIEYSNALNNQSVTLSNGGRNRHFEAFCRIREIKTADAGTKIQFRDPKKSEQ
jgi:hypothetical protein